MSLAIIISLSINTFTKTSFSKKFIFYLTHPLEFNLGFKNIDLLFQFSSDFIF